MIDERCKNTLVNKLGISVDLAGVAVAAGLTSVLRVRGASDTILLALGFTQEQIDAIKDRE